MALNKGNKMTEKKNETIGQKPFMRMKVGEMLTYPAERYDTVTANLARVRLRYQDRNYITRRTERCVYVIRDI